jgi:Chaperonin GroEL (HSP60 family)|nr:MAG TPA: GroEL [Caudoviricetes sp.]
MGKPTLNRRIVTGNELEDGIAEGIKSLYDVALTAYGCRGGNVMLEHRATAPTISHDGVSNLDELEVADAIQDMAIKVVKQASKRTNETAGDGTTLSAILSNHLYWWAMDKIKRGENPVDVAKEIENNVPIILDKITERTQKDLTPELLKGACIISAGDDGLGELIYDVVSEVGEFGGINVSYVGSLGVSTNIVKGMYLPTGYLDANLINDLDGNKSVLNDVPVIVLSSTVTRQDEILPLLENIRTHNYKKAVFFADITGDALRVLEMNRGFDACVIKPQSSNYEVLLKDVALYTGGEVFSGNPSDYKLKDYAGMADSVVVTQRETTILGGKGEAEKINEVVTGLKEKLSKAEPQDRAFLEGRIARLTANVATIYVGGASAVERGEVKLRVDDAVCAAKSALAGGVVAGGGVCLRDIAHETGLEYLELPYLDLLDNAGLAPQNFAKNVGYNLKDGVGDNMFKMSIIDPAIVIREAVINSHSVISKLITTKMALVYEDREWDF